jgi:hypothetical protein
VTNITFSVLYARITPFGRSLYAPFPPKVGNIKEVTDSDFRPFRFLLIELLL